MKKIYDKSAMAILPYNDNIVFVAAEKQLDDKFIVSYKMYDFQNYQVTQVRRSAYLEAKFGDEFLYFSKMFPDFINYKCAKLPDGRLISLYPNGDAAMFDNNYDIVWEGALKYRNSGPAGVACVDNSIWVSFPDGDTILRYNAATMREELRIGSQRDNAFSKPRGLWAAGKNLIVCNSAGKCIESVDTSSYVVEKYAQFDEPVYQYVKCGMFEVVLLDSGIYLL